MQQHCVAAQLTQREVALCLCSVCAVNEVIANVANEALGSARGSRTPVHPNDHVNQGQSSNDVFPTAVHLAAAGVLRDELLPSLRALEASLRRVSASTWGTLKVGRTHLQDALPMRMGSVFLGHADELASCAARLEQSLERDVCELAIGGTAVGTGFGAAPGFAAAVVQDLRCTTGLPLRETAAHFKAQASLDGLMSLSGAINVAALALSRVANAVRWLACGPRAGIGELALPAVQPGSSIMPGKINPVMAESLLQLCAHVAGGHAALSHAAATHAAFELHTAWPLAAHTLCSSMEYMGAGARLFAARCVDSIVPTERGPANARRSLMCATGLLPLVGYDAAARVAKAAAAAGEARELADVAVELLPGVDAAALREALSPQALLGPNDTPAPPA
jgi:fumarate hydratase class II